MADAGMVYRDEHPVNWCPRCETAIADAEVENIDREGTLHYVTFDGVDNGDIEIATTRPELLAACVGIVVSPDDDRYADRIGDTFEVPLFGQDVELLADDDVDADFGSGAVMVCTFGDKQDVEWWMDHDLDLRTVFTEDGHLNEAAGEFAGLAIDDAKTQVAEELDDQGISTTRNPPSRASGPAGVVTPPSRSSRKSSGSWRSTRTASWTPRRTRSGCPSTCTTGSWSGPRAWTGTG